MQKRIFSTAVVLVMFLMQACQSTPARVETTDLINRNNIDKIFIVDCLLPGVIRQLGSQFNYQGPRRAIRTSAVNCEIRGGEYTAFDRADYNTALKAWIELAEHGDITAAVNVGEVYQKGLGRKPDYQVAKIWYEKAAAAGNARARINLGFLYEKGLGVDKDVSQALNWYRLASGLDDKQLQFMSTIEVSVAAANEQQIAQLRRDIAASRHVQAHLRKQLRGTRSILEHRRVQLQKTMARLKQLQLHASQQQSVADEIINLKQNIALQRDSIKVLSDDIKHHGNHLNESELISSVRLGNDVAQLAGPSIRVLDHPALLTRGVPVLRLPVVDNYYHLRAQVVAPAGLLGFSVNGQRQILSKQGIYRLKLAADSGSTTVAMAAVDKSGRSARLQFSIEAQAESDVVAKPDVSPGEGVRGDVDFGQYYALVIGNNHYRNYPALKTAVNDARKVAALLTKQYGYQTRLIIDGDRYQILSALNSLRSKLRTQDNLLIYYAGHGEIDAGNQRGYWLPVDAEQGSNANWISNLDVTDILNVISAKHVLVIADSCYSGTLGAPAQTRLSLAQTSNKQRLQWIKVMARTRARIVMTSGGVKPVLDQGSDGHSIFARAFIQALQDNHSIIEGYRLYQQISEIVRQSAARLNVEQFPRYAPVKYGGGLGEYFFVRKRN